jgi:hypothetical protein
MKELLKSGMVVEWQQYDEPIEYGIVVIGKNESDSYIVFEGQSGLCFSFIDNEDEKCILKILKTKDGLPHYTICNATEILKGNIDWNMYDVIYGKVEKEDEKINIVINVTVNGGSPEEILKEIENGLKNAKLILK